MNLDTIVCMDALEFMATLPDASIDMVLCDLPYGTTACSWDEIIPFAPMWEQFTRVSKPCAAIVLTGSQPFTSKLVMSNLPMFRYEWIWRKSNVVGFINARYMPLDEHESILVFSSIRARSNQFTDEKMNYFPFGIESTSRLGTNKLERETAINNTRGNNKGQHHVTTQTGFPKSILTFQSERGLHPTQKPVALFEYLIRTYTQAGDVVLDCCMGSGTTAIAARNTGRHFIGCDSSPEYVELANKRLAKPWQPALLEG